MKRRLWVAALGAVVVLQVAVLGGLWAYSQYPRWVGQEVMLSVRPVDPRDLFRGSYLHLDYDIGIVPIPQTGVPRAGRTVYVTLKKQGPVWIAAEVQYTPPAGGLYLRGRITTVTFDAIRVRYGIEAWFTTAQRARALGTALRRGGVATVKVTPRGRAALLDVTASAEPAAP